MQVISAQANDIRPSFASQTVEQLIEVIENVETRELLLTSLRKIIKEKEEKPVQEKTGAATPERDEQTASSGLNTNFINTAEEHTDRFFNTLGRFIKKTKNISEFPEWFTKQITNKNKREFWLEIIIAGIFFPVGIALLAKWVVSLALKKTINRLRNIELETLRDRFITGIFRGLLEAVSVAAILMAGYLALNIVTRSVQSLELAELLVNGIALITGIGVAARLILSPQANLLRPVPISARTSAYLYIWSMRLATASVIGFVVAELVTPADAGGQRHAVSIFFAAMVGGMLSIVILQSKNQFGQVIKGDGLSRVRTRLSDIWHVLALIYVVVVFCVFSSGTQNGFMFLVTATAITITAIVVGSLLSFLIGRGIERLFRIEPSIDEKFPGLKDRSNLYRPVLRRIIDAFLATVVLLVILAGWEVNLYEAVSPELGGKIIKSAGTIIFVLVLCVIGWEFASSAISRALSKNVKDDKSKKVGSRSKTLLPLLRKAILIALIVFGGLIILAELGVDIAPLMAGAGVLGLAIGFGSQALVRDIITGLFILIEDTIAVGDVVTVGGHTGLVEDLSIRTIKLRDIGGTVHTVPFGDVTTVENLTKDFSFALLDIGVAYREDTDVVSNILEEISAELQADEVWGSRILEPIQVMGVQELADSAVIIRSRIKTKPIMQWGVKREFFRRMKKRFDLEGIEMPFPHTTLYFGENKDGSAPSANILMRNDFSKE